MGCVGGRKKVEINGKEEEKQELKERLGRIVLTELVGPVTLPHLLLSRYMPLCDID